MSHDPYDVFISYARRSAGTQAIALHESLRRRGLRVFLDRDELASGTDFPPRLAEAIAGSRLFVAIIDAAYFSRWYCVQEFLLALRDARSSPLAVGAKRGPAVSIGFVGAPSEAVLDALPPWLRTKHWPDADDASTFAAKVGAAAEAAAMVAAPSPSSHSELPGLAGAAKIPFPGALGSLAKRSYPRRIPDSLGERLVGRSRELWEIHLKLVVLPRTLNGGPPATVVLQGGAGVGKTRLALEYVHRYGPRYFAEGLFWLDAGSSPIELRLQLDTLAQRVAGESGMSRPLGAAAAAEMEARLLALLRPDMLLVLDNVPESEQPPSLDSWCVAVGRCSVLVTSRQNLALGERAASSIVVPPLSAEASVALLRSDLADRTVDAASYEAIAAKLGGLPLALELANRALYVRAWEPGALARQMRDVGAVKALEAGRRVVARHVAEGASRGVAAAFEASLERLSPGGLSLANALACVAPAPVLDALAERLGGPDARAELVARSVVQAAPALGLPVYGKMHALLAEYLRSRRPPGRLAPFVARVFRQTPEHRTRRAANRLALALVEVMAEKRDEAGGVIACAASVEMLLARGGRGCDLSKAAVDDLTGAFIRELLGDNASHGAHQPRLARLIQGVKSVDAALSTDVLESIALIDRALSLTDHPPVRGELANEVMMFTARPMSDDEIDREIERVFRGSAERYEETFRLRESALGTSHPATLWSLQYLAFSAAAIGETGAAGKWFAALGSACAARYGERARQTAAARVSAAWALFVAGDFKAAKDFRRRHLEWLRMEGGSDIDSTVGITGRLMLTAVDSGSREILEMALAVADVEVAKVREGLRSQLRQKQSA